MTFTLRIRPVDSADAAGLTELVRLNVLFNGASDSAEQIASRLDDPRRVETAFLAEIDGRIVGFAALRIVPCILYTEPYAELTELFVEEGYRRHGAGRALIVHAENLACQAGARQMLILTGFYNHSAQTLYRSMGYTHKDIGFVKDFGEK